MVYELKREQKIKKKEKKLDRKLTYKEYTSWFTYPEVGLFTTASFACSAKKKIQKLVHVRTLSTKVLFYVYHLQLSAAYCRSRVP